MLDSRLGTKEEKSTASVAKNFIVQRSIIKGRNRLSMKNRHCILAVVATILLSSCYEVKQDEKGRTIKVNRLTGEVSVIEGDKIITLKTNKDVKADQEAAKRLGAAKKWREIDLNIAGGTTANLVTKWSDGIMYYQFFVNKNLRGKGDNRAQLTIQLEDNASFLIEEISVPISAMTGTVGSDGKTVETMEHKSQRPMGEETYSRLTEWNVAWRGFDK